MPTIFDLLYREYCRARLAEMRKQLLISHKRHEVAEAFCDAKDIGARPADGSETITKHESTSPGIYSDVLPDEP
jgi:hypothetical protein